MQWPVKLVQSACLDAAVRLDSYGVCTTSGMPCLKRAAEDWARQAPPAAEALDRFAMDPRRGLQGTASFLTEVLAAARIWHEATFEDRQRLEASSGELAQIIFSQPPADAREGWLETSEWRMHGHLQLGTASAPSGARCCLVPASGPNAGQACGRTLLHQVVHQGRCTAGEQRVRIHNAGRWATSECLQACGLSVDQEISVPGWARVDARTGKETESVIDIEVRVPGSTQCTRVDLEAVHSEAVSNRRTAVQKLLLDAENEKLKRYGAGVRLSSCCYVVALDTKHCGRCAAWRIRQLRLRANREHPCCAALHTAS